ncbi:hypothetical protein [Clostridium sp.]|jgi:hypothetical protein|uniref:hypothetical protein n=1 Tax=Clostridium sp. TaxID=1506 RepID=UPI003EE9F934
MREGQTAPTEIPTTIDTLDVSEIYISSTKLAKTGTNTATFKYKVLNSFGKNITKTLPDSQIIISKSIDSTIDLDP